MEYYVTQPKDYWIAQNAINITLNALGDKNRIQCSVVSGAVIMCFLEDVKPASQGGDPENGDGLYYGANHEPKRWPLSISPTYFNTDSHKYVYVAIPRSEAVGTQAVIVFPSEELDIYGRARRLLTNNETGEPLLNEDGEQQVSYEQIGSTDYFYIYLNGIISAPAVNTGTGREERGWERAITDWGKLETAQGREERQNTNEWFTYSQVNQVVTFLKEIAMGMGSSFRNLILNHKNLTDVATSDIAYTDSDTMVATPGYVEKHYLSKSHDDSTPYSLTVGGILRAVTGYITSLYSNLVQSTNYTGDGIADTGYRLTADHNGHSKLTIDEIYVRMKAVFESLEVRERTYTGGDQIWSCAGNRVVRVDYLGNAETADHVPQMVNVHADGRPEGTGEGDVYSVPVPGDTYGYSDVKVPWLLRQMPLLARAKVFARYRKVRIVINEPAASSANRAAASESPLANIRRARCYFLAKDDDMEVHNWWRINDLARCQTMNLANTTRQTYISGEDQKAGNIFWWRKVIGVSYEPVTLDDGKQYHYFDVSFDYEYEKEHPEVMVTSVMEGSDIPAAQDSVVQFGNTIIEGRMNLMMMEVNGSDAVGYNPTTDAPCLKAYRGVYCFDLNKSWVGGNARKMMLSPKSGYEFYGPNFKQVTEYDVVPVPVDRGLWLDITPTRDDYREHALVRKCYYYNKVSHNGSYWLCSIVDGAHWVDGNGDYISDAAYSALTEEQKALCSRKQNYTIEEPSANSIDWTEVVKRGTSGNTPAMLFTTEPSGTTPDAPVCTAANYMNDILPQGWSKSAPNRADGYDVWMSQNTVIIGNDGSYTLKDVNWSEPTRISGDKGDPGADADDREWIYIADTEYRSTYADATHAHPDSISQGEVSPSGTASGSDTNKQQDDWVPNGWSDTAIATNDTTHKFVYASWRDKDRTTDTWGSFHDPILWSNWGVQGVDGDGVQYVFKLYADKLTSAQEESFKPTKGTQDASGEWSANNSTADTQSGSWQDDAPSPTENLPYCYCSVIKRLNGTWGNFETLGLWSRFSKDGKGQPDYIQTQEAWSNVESVASETTEPTPNGGWSDTTPANTNNYTYLWRRSRKMVLQSDDTYVPATGSDGQWKYTRLSGTNGTSISVKGTVATVADLNNISNPQDGDAYVVSANGHLYVWSSEAGTWVDLGEFKGDPGTTYYTHIAWASAVTKGTTPPGHTTTGQTTTPNATSVTNFHTAPFTGAAWMGVLINTLSGEDNPDALSYTWNEVKGPQGENGKDGWMVTANPANVIITQSLNNNTSSFSSATVSFTAKKGNVSAVIASIGTPTSSQFNVSKSGNTVTVSSPKTHGSPAEYYTEGSFKVNVNVTDPDTGNTVTFSDFTVLCYANLLGTWKRSVEAGVETVVAGLTRYLEDEDGNIITSESLRNDINDATQDLSTLSQTVTTQGQTIQNQNTRLSTAERNISTVTGKVNGLETSVSQISQTADEIKMSVNRGYRNYILNPKATDATTGRGTMSKVNDPVMGSVMNVYNSGSGDFQLICEFDDDNRSDLSYKVVTCYAVVKPKSSGTGTIDFGIWSANQQKPGLLEAHSTAEGVVSSVFCSESGATVGMVSVGNGWYIVWSSFNARSVFSETKESVGINSVNGSRWLVYGYGVMIGDTCPTLEAILTNTGLRSAGIDISDGTVNLYGNRVIFSNSTGTVSGKVWIDPDDGTIHATNGDFSGKITATSGSITGYLNVTGGLNVKNSGGSTIVQINGDTASTSTTTTDAITIVDAGGFYVKRGDEGFRLTTSGFQRYNPGTRQWVNFYGGRYVKTVYLSGSTSSTLTHYATVYDDLIIVNAATSTNSKLYLPQSPSEGKVISIINAGSNAFEIYGNGHKITAVPSDLDHATCNIRDRIELIYYNSKWHANYMSYLNYDY